MRPTDEIIDELDDMLTERAYDRIAHVLADQPHLAAIVDCVRRAAGSSDTHYRAEQMSRVLDHAIAVRLEVHDV